MAAKVVMVAVPTVMGIASIRVYTVSEVPTDGLVTREKLNLYTPLPQSAQARFVPERPGVIQSGLTTARERILPLVQAVKGACVSVKTRSVNLYYAGEDVYYYLKDPPPGFLPRFGTVTMAGLLGMFLARKGSHFKRLAVPLSLMSAGASVCYPAQTVAVLKVTGKKVYAVGQWSSAAVSSLLASKSQEPDLKEIAASQPQPAAVVEEASEPSTTDDSSAQNSAIPETEVESAESVPVSDEPVVAVITEEASSVKLTEINPDQTPTGTVTDPVANSVPEETKAIAASEEITASVENEKPSDTKQAAKDVSTDASPAEPTPSLEPETLKASPVESASAEAAPLEAAPVEAPAVEAPAVEAPAVEAPLVDASPVESAPVESALVDASPVESAPAETPAMEAPVVEAAQVETASMEASNEPTVPVVESAGPEEPAVQPELTDPPQVAAVEETLTPPQQPEQENNKGGSGFKPDPALMDFGQSNPEDEDLYSTRS